MTTNFKILLLSISLFGGTNGYCQKNDKDSLRNPYSEYYLTDVNLRTAAQMLVQGSIQPLDNKVTFSILDSVTKGDQDTRNYYSKAFDIIIFKSDGALSEVIGSYCINSIYRNPNELMVWLSSGQFESTPETIAQYIAYELIMGEFPEKEKEKLLEKINTDANNTITKEYSEKLKALINQEFELLKE